jgi:hypothetical protein
MATTSLVYVVEKAFSEPSMGQLVVLCTNMLVGMLTIIATLILKMLWWIEVNQAARLFYFGKKVFCDEITAD